MSFRAFINERSTEEVSKDVEPLNEEVRASLQAVLDAVMHAANITQVAHWNLRSSAFVAIHPWFGDTYDALFDLADAVAEQIKIADINLMVQVSSFTSIPKLVDEQTLFLVVKDALQNVKTSLENAGADGTLSRALQALIDNWMADITKMIWFINASTM